MVRSTSLCCRRLTDAVFVGTGATADGGLEMKSDRVGIPTGTSDPGSSVVGDMYMQTVGAGATVRIYDGSSYNDI